MNSREIEVSEFALIGWILEAKFGYDPLVS